MRKKLYLVDAANFLFRSFFAIRGMSTKQGTPTNALYGFIRSIEKIIKDFSPEYMAIVFDGPSNKASRTAIYEAYKSHREGMPEDLVIQLAPALEFCRLSGLPLFQIEGIEADDTIGSIARFAKENSFDAVLLSSDKDLCQLVDPHCQMVNASKDNLVIDEAKVKELYGIRPDQMVDYLAIVGDASDNIPGVSGLGPKAAEALLQEFGTLENIYHHLEEIKSASQRKKMEEGKENALLSQKLATIDCHIAIPTEIEHYKIKERNLEGLAKLYEQMEFSTLLKSLGEAGESKKPFTAGKYHLIETKEAFEALLTKLQKAKEICIDTESTSLEKMQAKLVGIGFCIDPKEAFYVPFNHSIEPEWLLKKLKTLFENSAHAFFGHNIKYDLHILANHGLFPAIICFDTMLASYILHPEKNRHGLDELTEEIFGYQKVSFKELVGKEENIGHIPVDKVCYYCCEDVLFTYQLFEHFEPLLIKESQEFTFYEIELPLLPILFAMERKGVFVDPKMLSIMSSELKKEIDKIEKEIYALSNQTFNIKSPKQLATVLFEDLKIPYPKKGKNVSTAADILESIQNNHPIIEKILQFRMLDKLRSTYVDALPLQIDQTTGRIHCTFNQTGTATGRLASQDPNLQNIPIRSHIGKTIRNAFKPGEPGYSFLSADYSQIELRIVAHLSQDENMINAFHHSSDIHRATAALIFGIKEEDVTDEMRSSAKAVNFGIIYGQGPFGLSQVLKMDVRSAGKFIHDYYERYKGIKTFLDKAKDAARQNGFTSTMTHRKRAIPDINSKNSFLRAAAERLAVNSPIQGTQADIIKMAMIKLDQEMDKKGLKSALILQIHDELIFECKDSELTLMEPLVKEVMENIVKLTVPLKVDIHIGKNWGEC